jgi:Secretion system C-terminal sorting domain
VPFNRDRLPTRYMRMRTVYTILLWAAVQILVLPTAAHSQSKSTDIQVLMLDICTYDAYYTEQISNTIAQMGTDIDVSRYSDEVPTKLEVVLENIDIVVVPYPHHGTTDQLKAYGAVLKQFASRGGMVVFTGTHDMSKLNLFNVFACEKGSYNPFPQIQRLSQVLFTKQIPEHWTSTNFTYPVSISNTNYVNLASDDGHSVYGYMKQGAGLIFYVGLEYYTIEAVNRTILENLVSFVRNQKTQKLAAKTIILPIAISDEPAWGGPFDIRNLSILPNVAVEWTLYPNPYVSRATVAFQVERQSRVEVSIFNEQGRLVSRPVSDNTYEPGRFTLEINDLASGTFFVQLRIGDEMSVKKLVRVSGP